LSERPFISIATGDALPRGTAELYALNNMGDEIEFPVSLTSNRMNVYHVFDCTKDVPDSIIWNGIDCLEDHMDNVELSEWTNKKEDIFREFEGNYDVHYGVYHGQGIDIHVYYLSNSNSFN
jgi:hypothetical protein